jgi:hypothetical protein
MRRLLLPSGPLRRFRLPPGAARSERPEPTKRRAWALLPFGAFGLLTLWLSAGRPVPDVRHWLEGPPRADRAAPEGARHGAPRLEAAPSLAASQVASEAAAAEARPPPAKPATEAREKRPKRKPPLVLERHRLRPVLGWEDPSRSSLSAVPPAEPRGNRATRSR